MLQRCNIVVKLTVKAINLGVTSKHESLRLYLPPAKEAFPPFPHEISTHTLLDVTQPKVTEGRPTPRVALNRILQRYYIVQPIRGYIKHFALVNYSVDRVDLSEAVCLSLIRIAPIIHGMSIGRMIDIADDSELFASVRWC